MNTALKQKSELTDSDSTNQITSYLTTGYDPGFGQVKLVISGCRDVVIPSYFFECEYAQSHNIPESLNGGFVQYQGGSRTDLIGTSWLAGYPAYLENPNRYTKAADSRKAKAELGLQLLLGALATHHHRDEWNLYVVCSVHDVETFGAKLNQSLEGTHTVAFGGSDRLSRVNIRIAHVYEEGYGVAATRLAATHQRCTRLLYDIGSGTIRVVAFGPSGNVVGSPVSINEGVDSLITAIAQHPDMKAFEDGAEGDRHLIRVGIEQHTFNYGSTGWNFGEIYHTELRSWAKAVLLRVLKAGQPYQKSAEETIASGGGSNLPDLRKTLTSYGIIPIQDSVLANAHGLKQLADLMLSKGV